MIKKKKEGEKLRLEFVSPFLFLKGRERRVGVAIVLSVVVNVLKDKIGLEYGGKNSQ